MPHPTVIELIEASGQGTATIRFVPSGEERSIAQIWRDSEQVARWLRVRVGTGVNVGAFLSNTPDCPAVVFGIWRSGNTLVSLPYPGRGTDFPRYLGQVASMCEFADVELTLVDEAYRTLLPTFPTAMGTFQEAHAGGPATDVASSGGVIQFTSGSIGTPKGVVLSGAAIAANILSILDAVEPRPGDTACTWLPLSHDMGFIGMFLAAVTASAPAYGGEALVLQTPESFLADPASWLRSCAEIKATMTTAPNFAFDLAGRTKAMLPGLDLSRLRVCITGAERVSAATLRRFTSTFADAGLSPAAICPAYGMAEATLAVSMVRPDEVWRELSVDRAELAAGRLAAATGPDGIEYVSNGRPLAGMDVRVAGGPLGELQLRGPSMLSDYVGAQLELVDDGWFPTRDQGFLRDGEVYLTGRSDDTIIVGGRNHYAADIEAVVRHGAVREGCLAAVPFEEGYGIIAEPVRGLDPAELERACREIAANAASAAGVRPSLVAFVPRGRLPKTPSGKLQRLALRSAVQSGEVELTASISAKGS